MIISISNHKGGVGKTTSTINIGAGLNQLDKNVLLLDFDPQSNLTQSLNITDIENNIYGALRGKHNLKPVNILPQLDLIPATLDLSGAEIEISAETGREYLLKELLEEFQTQYDYILIDNPPSLGLLTINAFAASDKILIPMQAEYLAMQGLGKFMEVLNKVKTRINQKLTIGGAFITQFDNRKVLNREVEEILKNDFKDKLFSTKIRNNIALAEAPSQGLDIFRYAPKSNGALDYMALCKEIIMIK